MSAHSAPAQVPKNVAGGGHGHVAAPDREASPLAKLPKLDVKARLGAAKFVTDGHDFAHITVDPDICDTCPHEMCINTCPAKCFEFVNGRMQFTYEDCVECGTCDIVCTPGSVKWTNPRASFGVNYRYG